MSDTATYVIILFEIWIHEHVKIILSAICNAQQCFENREQLVQVKAKYTNFPTPIYSLFSCINTTIQPVDLYTYLPFQIIPNAPPTLHRILLFM